MLIKLLLLLQLECLKAALDVSTRDPDTSTVLLLIHFDSLER